MDWRNYCTVIIWLGEVRSQRSDRFIHSCSTLPCITDEHGWQVTWRDGWRKKVCVIFCLWSVFVVRWKVWTTIDGWTERVGEWVGGRLEGKARKYVKLVLQSFVHGSIYLSRDYLQTLLNIENYRNTVMMYIIFWRSQALQARSSASSFVMAFVFPVVLAPVDIYFE